jgi:hypothetical protein
MRAKGLGPIVSVDDMSEFPTLQELRMLRAYGDYLLKHHSEPGTNFATVFKKMGPNAWVYRMVLWTQGPTYVPCSQKTGLPEGEPLKRLLDHIEGVGDDTPQRIKWAIWKVCDRPVLL